MRGKCNCGKKATAEYLIINKGIAWTVKLCVNCKPKQKAQDIQLISGK